MASTQAHNARPHNQLVAPPPPESITPDSLAALAAPLTHAASAEHDATDDFPPAAHA